MKNNVLTIGRKPATKEGQKDFRFGFFKTVQSVKLFSFFIGLIVAILSIFSVSQLKGLNTEYSLEQFFPAQHPLLKQSQKIRQTFQLQEQPSYLIVLEGPNWLTPAAMANLTKVTKKIRAMKEVRSAFSIGTLEGALNQGTDLTIGPLYERLPAKNWKNFTQDNELIRSQLISKDGKSVLLIVEPAILSMQALNDFSKKLKTTFEKNLPGVKSEIGGVPAIQAQLSSKLLQELRLFLFLSLIAFCGVFCLFFQGFSAIVLTLVVLIVVNANILGAVAYFKIPFSILLTTLPIVVSISLVSVMIHSLHRWAEETDHLRGFQARFRGAWIVFKEMALANFLGSLTTGIGFITLCTTDIPLIRQYGWVVATSVMCAWVLTSILLLGFMSYTKPVLREWTKKKAYWTLFMMKRSRLLFVGTLAFAMVFAVVGLKLSFSGRLFDDLPARESARHATEKIDENFGGVNSYELVLTAANNDFWKEPANLKKMQKTLAQVRHMPTLGSAISLTDFFDSGRVPASKNAVAEFLFLYSMAESNPLKNYVTDNGKILRVALRFHDVPGKEIELSRDKLKRLMGRQFPQVKIQEAGIAVSSHTINREVSRNLVFNFWHSILLVGLLLVLVFRSLRWALVACIPNFLPPAFLIGSLALAQTPVKPGVALIFSIALGLAFNNTVYLLSRMRRIMREQNLSAVPLKRAFMQEGNPCLFETLVMFSGFVIFLSSDFRLNQIFGVYMLLSIVAGALSDLVFLPAWLRTFPSLLRGRKVVLPLIEFSSEVSTSVVASSKATTSSQKTGKIEKIAASFALMILLGLGAPQKVAAANEAKTSAGETKAGQNEAKELLKTVQKQLEAKDDQALVKMKIIESNGEVKSRTLQMQTLRDKKFHVLARIQAPADIKGTGFLAEISDQAEDQWIYLPSSKQVRRVVGTKKSAGVLGSELTMEDLNSTAIKGSAVRLVKKDAQIFVIELIPKAGTSVYNRVLMSFSIKDNVPLQTQYFQGQKLKKTVAFNNYKKVGPLWRAQQIKVKNLVNKRGTDLEFSAMKVNAGLNPDDFSVSALKPD